MAGSMLPQHWGQQRDWGPLPFSQMQPTIAVGVRVSVTRSPQGADAVWPPPLPHTSHFTVLWKLPTTCFFDPGPDGFFQKPRALFYWDPWGGSGAYLSPRTGTVRLMWEHCRLLTSPLRWGNSKAWTLCRLWRILLQFLKVTASLTEHPLLRLPLLLPAGLSTAPQETAALPPKPLSQSHFLVD